MVTAKQEPAQEETKNYPQHPLGDHEAAPRGYFAEFGFLLGPATFGGDHFLTTFLAYVVRRPKTIILPFLGFGLSRRHVLYDKVHMGLFP